MLWQKLASLNWVRILQSAGGIALTIAIGLALIRLGRRGFKALERRRQVSKALISVLVLILRWVVLVVVALLVVTQIGVNIGSLWSVASALLAIVGIGFVAVWSMLSNISSTFLLLIYHPFSIGDEIELIEPTGGAGLRGRVTGLNFMFTTLEEKDSQTGELLITQIPNNTFFQKTIRRRLASHPVALDQHIMTRTQGGESDGGGSVL